MIEGRTLVCQVSLLNNDGQTSIDSIDEFKCEKFYRFLPAGETASGGMRRDPLIQFYAERMVDGRGRELFATVRTVSAMSVIAIKGKPKYEQERKPVVKARTRAQRLALRGK